MRTLSIVLILLSGSLYGQTDQWKPDTLILKPLHFTDNITMGLNDKYRNTTQQNRPIQTFDPWIDQTRIRQFTGNQLAMFGFPSMDFSDHSEIFMGSLATQQLKMGKMRLIQNYVFDLDGTLRNSQLTIQLGDDN